MGGGCAKQPDKASGRDKRNDQSFHEPPKRSGNKTTLRAALLLLRENY